MKRTDFSVKKKRNGDMIDEMRDLKSFRRKGTLS